MPPTTLVDTLLAWQRDTLEKARVAVPGQIVSYNPAPECTAQVQLVLQGGDAIGTRQILPPLQGVPVIFPRGGGFTLEWPLQPGDEVLVLVADRAIHRWLEQGGIVGLESDRTHHLADAIVLPGLSSRASPRLGGATELVLGREDGSAAVRISLAGDSVTVEAPQIRLGIAADPGSHVAIAEALHAYLSALFAAGLPAPNDGGAALQTAWQLYLSSNPPSGFAATKAIAE